MKFIRQHFIPSLLMLILLCSVFSCKRVTKKNEFEYYSGMLVRHSWSSISSFDSAISTLKIHHLTNRIDNKMDTFQLTYPTLWGTNDSRILFYKGGNSDSLVYSDYTQYPNGPIILTKYFSPKRITMSVTTYSGVIDGQTITFSGEKK